MNEGRKERRNELINESEVVIKSERTRDIQRELKRFLQNQRELERIRQNQKVKNFLGDAS